VGADGDLRHQLLDDPDRQAFERNMINTLQTGASNLVLADQNQERVNLLTVQQLEISSLSIANQSVLKPFP
jgi:flagellin